MHPSIRVLCVVILAANLPALALIDLLLLQTLLLGAYALQAPGRLQMLLGGLWRLRWLFIAIAVLYLGFTPGTAIHPALPGISQEGLFEGLRRMLVLSALLTTVYLLIAVTSSAELAAALCQLLAPLKPLGVPVQRFALRLSLSMEMLSQVQGRIEAARRQQPRALADAAVGAILEVEQLAGQGPGTTQLPRLRRPGWLQWLLPLWLLLLALGLPR